MPGAELRASPANPYFDQIPLQLGFLSTRISQCAYQSECGDQRPHDRHCVAVHLWRHTGQMPSVSNVFHSLQVQDQRSSLRGDQPQSG
jgi:hypothetical protein